MNSIDLIPVDLFPRLAGLVGLDHLRPLPTADLNGPLGHVVGRAPAFCSTTASRSRGPRRLRALSSSQRLSAAFPLLWPVQSASLNIIEYLRQVRLARACDSSATCMPVSSLFFLHGASRRSRSRTRVWPFRRLLAAGIGQVFAGLVWWLFHVLIVLLQAFIFMMLTLVYIGQAHSSH